MNGRSTVAQIYKEISIRDLVAPAFRRKKTIALAFVTIFTAVILLFSLLGYTYSSRMEIMVNRERQDPMVTTEATTQMLTTSAPVTVDEINSETELLLSRDVLEKVAVANKLDLPHGSSIGEWLHPNQTPEERVARVVKRLAKQIKVKPIAKTDLIEVQYSSASPELSNAVLHSLADAYMVKHISAHRPGGAFDFFARETQNYHDELQTAESKLRDFGQQNGVSAPDVERTNLAQQVALSTGILHAAQQAAAADEGRIRNDHEQMGKTPDRSPTVKSSAGADLLLENLNTALLAAQAKRAQLLMKYAPTYPLVLEEDLEIAQITAAIKDAEKTRYVSETTDRDPTYELLREDIARATADHAAQVATAAAATQSIASMQAQMVKLDHDAIMQGDLTREVKADETNYLLYLSKREQERTSDALDMKRIANVTIAVPPAISALPVLSWPLMISIALGSALLLSLAMAFMMDYLDQSFHSPAQVIDILGIPLVVAVSKKTA